MHEGFPFGHARVGRDVLRHALLEIPAVGLGEHHKTAVENIDVHPGDAGALEARHHFRPDLLMVRSVAVDDRGVVLEIDGEHGAGPACAITGDHARIFPHLDGQVKGYGLLYR